MASYNKVILMGNLTRDPEVKYTQNNTAIANFGLAVNERYSNSAGEKREEVTFVDVEAFGKQAEVIAQHLKKGNPLFLEGSLKYDQWETQDGQKRNRLKVRLRNFQFMGGRSEASPEPVEAAPPPTTQEAPATVNEAEDDIPF